MVIKGVNRKIIEVCDTGNIYFERAILFVKTEYISRPPDVLTAQAKNYLNNISSPAPASKKTRAEVMNDKMRLQKRRTARKIINALMILSAAGIGFLLSKIFT